MFLSTLFFVVVVVCDFFFFFFCFQTASKEKMFCEMKVVTKKTERVRNNKK